MLKRKTIKRLYEDHSHSEPKRRHRQNNHYPEHRSELTYERTVRALERKIDALIAGVV